MEQQKYLAEKRRLEIEAMRKLTPAERIQKSSLNSGVRFDLSNPKDYDVSA